MSVRSFAYFSCSAWNTEHIINKLQCTRASRPFDMHIECRRVLVWVCVCACVLSSTVPARRKARAIYTISPTVRHYSLVSASSSDGGFVLYDLRIMAVRIVYKRRKSNAKPVFGYFCLNNF